MHTKIYSNACHSISGLAMWLRHTHLNYIFSFNTLVQYGRFAVNSPYEYALQQCCRELCKSSTAGKVSVVAEAHINFMTTHALRCHLFVELSAPCRPAMDRDIHGGVGAPMGANTGGTNPLPNRCWVATKCMHTVMI